MNKKVNRIVATLLLSGMGISSVMPLVGDGDIIKTTSLTVAQANDVREYEKIKFGILQNLNADMMNYIYKKQYEEQIEVLDTEIQQPIILNRWNITLSQDEIDLLARVLWREARGESDEGQLAVVEVVFNRMIHQEFTGTLYEVLSRDKQFTSWKLQSTAEPTDREYENINKVLNGESNIFGYEKVYFSTSPRNDSNTVKIGNHYFCDFE